MLPPSPFMPLLWLNSVALLLLMGRCRCFIYLPLLTERLVNGVHDPLLSLGLLLTLWWTVLVYPVRRLCTTREIVGLPPLNSMASAHPLPPELGLNRRGKPVTFGIAMKPRCLVRRPRLVTLYGLPYDRLTLVVLVCCYVLARAFGLCVDVPWLEVYALDAWFADVYCC